MAYNNGFPVGYQAPYQQSYYPMNNYQTQQQSGLIWVQGEAAAKAYLVAPGCTVQLWDSEEKVIYLKSADASGMPSMKILDYTIRGDANTPAIPSAEFATKEEVNALAEKVQSMKDELAGITKRRSRLMKEEDFDE